MSRTGIATVIEVCFFGRRLYGKVLRRDPHDYRSWTETNRHSADIVHQRHLHTPSTHSCDNRSIIDPCQSPPLTIPQFRSELITTLTTDIRKQNLTSPTECQKTLKSHLRRAANSTRTTPCSSHIVRVPRTTLNDRHSLRVRDGA